jgi:hypothetical protein
LRIKKDDYKKKYQEKLPLGRDASVDSVEIMPIDIDDKIVEYKKEVKSYRNQSIILTKENDRLK